MLICANENLSDDCVLRLREDGHGVLWIREAAPGSSDTLVLARACAEKRILITFDKDFGELVFLRSKRTHRRVTRSRRFVHLTSSLAPPSVVGDFGFQPLPQLLTRRT